MAKLSCFTMIVDNMEVIKAEVYYGNSVKLKLACGSEIILDYVTVDRINTAIKNGRS
jgi:hypothetical protein